MEGTFSINKSIEGKLEIILEVNCNESVEGLTLDMYEAGVDIIFEPRYVSGKYQSNILYNENINIKIKNKNT